jgi:hypothetical protein
MFYCKVCDNILDISKKSLAKLEKNDTKSIITDEDLDYDDMLKKLEDGVEIDEETLKKINISNMIKVPYYKKMNNKGLLKNKLMIMIEDMTNSDSDVHAYHVCANGLFSEQIKTGFHVLTRPTEKNQRNRTSFVDIDKLRNLCYMNTLPRTRNFSCVNIKCPSRTPDVPQEAVFVRLPGSYQLYYVCTTCHTIKMN